MTVEHYVIVALAAVAAFLGLMLWWRWYFDDCARPLPETTAELLEDDDDG